ncbi:hypothetical protein GMLC_06430 [Geomonas limicola]|uniref:Uncharacterized protein n=1 Tax=Geomonas limicola TaxID=2740186 RepID=A0A6V8N539_9BACT|nr:hypothetical protein GMLC_06430 [Geomonas limicola]
MATVRVATLLVTLEALFVATARYLWPLFPLVVAAVVYEVEVAPFMSPHVDPPSVLSCHFRVGVGVPVTATVKVAVFGAVTDAFVGWVVNCGAVEVTVTGVGSELLQPNNGEKQEARMQHSRINLVVIRMTASLMWCSV